MFGRDETFDAATDPLVRVQANRLRKAIERYYLTHGIEDSIRISVPKGKYVAVFERVSALSPDSSGPGISQPTVAVLPFSTIGESEQQEYFADGLTEELTTALAQVENFAVISRHSTYQFASRDQSIREIGQILQVRFIMEGTVQRSSKALRVTAQLTDTSNGLQIWADSFSSKLKAKDIFEIQDEIVGAVTSRVADAFGVIPRLLEKETRGKRANSLDAYDALLRFFHYQTHLGPDTYDWARRGLEKAVEKDPEFAPALAALAELACDNLSLRYHEPYDRIEEAYEYARRAVSADPACQLAHYSMAFVHFHRKNREGCIQSARQVIELNPNSPYFVGVAGWLMALAGDWDRGLGVLFESVKRNPFLSRLVQSRAVSVPLLSRRVRGGSGRCRAYDSSGIALGSADATSDLQPPGHGRSRTRGTSAAQP